MTNPHGKEASGHLAWDVKKRISAHAQITTSLCQEVFTPLERHPKIVRILEDVGPRLVQLPFPASVLAWVHAAPIVLGFFDNGKFMLTFCFVC